VLDLFAVAPRAVTQAATVHVGGDAGGAERAGGERFDEFACLAVDHDAEAGAAAAGIQRPGEV
jgi:hypothetical protein